MYKGHDLPQLRGVMSPQQFDEQDFADLAAWNVNVVRWQIMRNWGQANTDLDLEDSTLRMVMEKQYAA